MFKRKAKLDDNSYCQLLRVERNKYRLRFFPGEGKYITEENLLAEGATRVSDISGAFDGIVFDMPDDFEYAFGLFNSFAKLSGLAKATILLSRRNTQEDLLGKKQFMEEQLGPRMMAFLLRISFNLLGVDNMLGLMGIYDFDFYKTVKTKFADMNPNEFYSWFLEESSNYRSREIAQYITEDFEEDFISQSSIFPYYAFEYISEHKTEYYDWQKQKSTKINVLNFLFESHKGKPSKNSIFWLHDFCFNEGLITQIFRTLNDANTSRSVKEEILGSILTNFYHLKRLLSLSQHVRILKNHYCVLQSRIFLNGIFL